MKNSLKTLISSAMGIFVGFINGLFGAGGGLICVPVLIKSGVERKKAHANAVTVILSVCIASAVNYLISGRVKIEDSLTYIPGGLLGAITGTFIMKKIKPDLIKRIFAIFMLWAGWRLISG